MNDLLTLNVNVNIWREKVTVYLFIYISISYKFCRKMREIANSSSFQQIKLLRKYLKLKVLEDDITFRKHEKARTHVYDVMKRTVSGGESHSALMIGPRGSGKTTVSTVLLLFSSLLLVVNF